MPTEAPARPALAHAGVALDALATRAGGFAGLDDKGLLEAQRVASDARAELDRYRSLIAAEIARRSSPDLGYAGLAQRAGHFTAEGLIDSLGGGTRAEVGRFVRVGHLLSADGAAQSDPAAEDSGRPLLPATPAGGTGDAATTPTVTWRALLADAVHTGALAVDSADLIGRIFTELTVELDRSQLDSVQRLIDSAAGMTSSLVARRARVLRDELDPQGVALREQQRRERRTLRYWWADDGMLRLNASLDPENGAIVADALDQLTSPRRGPRFVDPESAHAENDDRTLEQLAADSLVDLIQLAVDVDDTTLFGARRPGVRVLVTRRDLESPEGSGRIEGRDDAVSTATVERILCGSGAVPILFDDDGRCLNVGRDSRLFTARQRTALAARDGGCVFPDCDRPPAWCEAHHIRHWHRDGGGTDVDDGVLLCRRHHLLVHNNHWSIARDGSAYAAIPPPQLDPAQTPVPLHSRNPLVSRLTRAN